MTTSVLLASVSDALRSRDVEFMTNVLLEYQVPICQSRKKRRTKRRQKRNNKRGVNEGKNRKEVQVPAFKGQR